MTQTTRKIREQLKATRQSLTATEKNVAALLIAKRLLQQNAIYRAENIAVYLPVGGEVDCRFFLKAKKMRKKRIFLPVVAKSNLLFAPLIPGAEMRRNHFGILEPVYERSELISPAGLDVVIAPLVAFDAKCNRIGMGGGFYDRSFAFRKRRRRWRRPLLIGLAYDFQRVSEILPQAWDVPLDSVITERHSYPSN